MLRCSGVQMGCKLDHFRGDRGTFNLGGAGFCLFFLVELFLDIVGVTGSIPVTPTILKASKFNDLLAFAISGVRVVSKAGEAKGKHAGANQSNLASRVQPSQQRPQLGAGSSFCVTDRRRAGTIDSPPAEIPIKHQY